MIVRPGTDVEIAWTLNVNIAHVSYRIWSFGRFVTPLKIVWTELAALNGNKKFFERQNMTALPSFEIKRPASLILKNVNHLYNGRYSFNLGALPIREFSKVTVFVVGKFFFHLLLNNAN